MSHAKESQTKSSDAGCKPLPISATIITLNEQAKIAQCIKSLSFCSEVIVVDSHSSDETAHIASALGARVFQNRWQGYGAQKNFAHQLATQPWVLNVDADEVITPELAAEIKTALHTSGDASVSGTIRGFRVARKSFYLGRWIRYGGWYPNYVTRLALKQFSRWTEPQVHEELHVDGVISDLKNPMLHYTFDSVTDQITTNIRYAKQGAAELHQRGQQANILALLFKPLGKFCETYFLKLGFRDGLRGFIISKNAAYSMFLKQVYLFELQGQFNKDNESQQK